MHTGSYILYDPYRCTVCNSWAVAEIVRIAEVQYPRVNAEMRQYIYTVKATYRLYTARSGSYIEMSSLLADK